METETVRSMWWQRPGVWYASLAVILTALAQLVMIVVVLAMDGYGVLDRVRDPWGWAIVVGLVLLIFVPVMFNQAADAVGQYVWHALVGGALAAVQMTNADVTRYGVDFAAAFAAMGFLLFAGARAPFNLATFHRRWMQPVGIGLIIVYLFGTAILQSGQVSGVAMPVLLTVVLIGASAYAVVLGNVCRHAYRPSFVSAFSVARKAMLPFVLILPLIALLLG
jgi:hypothetical protein